MKDERKHLTAAEVDKLITATKGGQHEARDLLERPPTQWIQSAMALMEREHSWEQRATVLLSLIYRVLGNSLPDAGVEHAGLLA